MDIEKEITVLGMIVCWIGFKTTDGLFRYLYLFMAIRYNFELFRVIVRQKVKEIMGGTA